MVHTAEDLLNRMTLQEKVALLAGSDMWHTTPVKRLGIPALKVTDGPNGARGAGSLQESVPTACFPASIALAATWNTELVNRIGRALGQQARAKGAHILLAPTVNIHRSPLNGRNFESFSEDPYLSARLVVAYITGVQQEGIGTSVKHFVCNDSEFERATISSEVGERVLREIYLRPFQIAVREADPWILMAAYNGVNGTAMTEHAYLLTDILRNEWGYEGVVVSDWLVAMKSTVASINAGLDLEMPGPSIWRGEKLVQAVKRGEVTEATLERSVVRLLKLLERADVFEHPEERPEQAMNVPEHGVLIREAAAEGMVLLKNEGAVLPLQEEQLNSIAIIGPNAKVAQIMAGGSAQVTPYYAVTPYDGIVARAREGISIRYEQGCTNHKLQPLLEIANLLAGFEGTSRGFRVEYFNSSNFSAAPVATEERQSSEIQWMGGLPEAVDAKEFSVRCLARFVPQRTGNYVFGLVSAGLSRLLIDGREVIDNWVQQVRGDAYFGMGSTEVVADVPLEAGKEYRLTVEYRSREEDMLAAVRLGCLPPLETDAIARAVAVAASSDVAIVCAGLSGEWESEGFDRPDIDLVGEQNALIEQVAQANSRTIVVLNTGSPVAMPWLENVAAVLQAWFPGQECGNAIADVLFGDVTPSGKLPQTFPVRVEDHPAYLNYPGENDKVHYGEGLFVGYRYYEKKKVAPLFPFGFGLSYTTFDYADLKLSADRIGPDDTLEVSIDVRNSGERAGKEIVQLYVRDVASTLHRPEKELKAFSKVQLEAGERKTVVLSLTRDELAYYDELARSWVAEAGEFEVLVGSSSQDIRARATFTLTTTRYFDGAPTIRRG